MDDITRWRPDQIELAKLLADGLTDTGSPAGVDAEWRLMNHLADTHIGLWDK